MTWADDTLTSFALATTGIEPAESRLVAYATRTVNDGTNAPATTTVINTPVQIPADATRVHGLTNKDTAAGLTPAQALTEITTMLHTAASAGHGIVIFHSEWFFQMLHAEASAANVRLDLPARMPLIDPIVIDKHINPARASGNRTLRALSRSWGLHQNQFGSAATNADGALRLAWRIGHTHGAVRHLTLDELHDAQVRWDQEAAQERDIYRDSRGRVA